MPGGGDLPDIGALRNQSNVLDELAHQQNTAAIYSNQPSYNSVSTGTGEYTRAPYQSNSPYNDLWQFQSGGGGGGGGGGGLSSASRNGSSGSFNSNTNTGFRGGSFGDVFSNISGGGNQQFNQNQAEGFNPYQYTPTVQNLQRPDRAVLPLSDEEEYIRQLSLGSLLGEHPGEDTAYQELLNTVGGAYLGPDSNPYLADQINATGADVSQQFNKNINDILNRAGIGGALGGSRAALMLGQGAGEATRGFNSIESALLNEDYQAERNRQLAAIPGLLSTEGMPVQRYGQAMNLAGIPRNLDQQETQFRINELLRQQNERLMPIQVGQSVLGQSIGQSIPVVNQQGSKASGLGSLISGIGSLGSSLGSMLGPNGLNISNPFAGLGLGGFPNANAAGSSFSLGNLADFGGFGTGAYGSLGGLGDLLGIGGSAGSALEAGAMFV